MRGRLQENLRGQPFIGRCMSSKASIPSKVGRQTDRQTGGQQGRKRKEFLKEKLNTESVSTPGKSVTLVLKSSRILRNTKILDALDFQKYFKSAMGLQ